MVQFIKIKRTCSKYVEFYITCCGNNIKYRKTTIGMRGGKTDILVKYFLELRRTCPNHWWSKVLPAYCHLNKIYAIYNVNIL